MRKFLVSAAAGLLITVACAAPATTESVETLLALTRTESMMDTVYGSMEQMMRQGMQQSLRGRTVSEEQQRVMDAVARKFVALAREEMNWGKMKPLYVRLYIDTFEQEEVDGLINFYQSPAGQAFVRKMPVVMQKSMAITQSQMQALFPKMRTAIEEAIAEAKVRIN